MPARTIVVNPLPRWREIELLRRPGETMRLYSLTQEGIAEGRELLREPFQTAKPASG
jgi:hypothetical protein